MSRGSLLMGLLAGYFVDTPPVQQLIQRMRVTDVVMTGISSVAV
jgi:hypothetical protein